jgi:choline monooxygenase
MMNYIIGVDIARSKTISTDFYLNPSVFEASKEKIFSATFQYIGCKDEFTDQVTCKPITLLENYLDEPLVVTKDTKGTFQCLSNVCTHRGNLLVTEPCKLRNLTCKYHGRQFELNGDFRSMPEFKEVEDFPTEADNLHQLKVFEFGNLMFTSLHPNIDSIPFFEDMKKRMGWYPLEELKFEENRSRTFQVKANWALYCENFLEGFHIPFVHKGLNEVLDFNNYTTEIFNYSNLQIGIAKEGEVSFDLPFNSPDNGKNVAAYYFWVFPNLMFNFYPWGLSLNVVEPISPSETKVTFHSFVLDETKYDLGAGGGLDTVEQEDEEVVENVQKGIRSRFYDSGRYSVTREQGTHHLHRLLAEFLMEENK